MTQAMISRRTALGGAALASFAGAAGITPILGFSQAATSSVWNAALRRFEAARAACNDHARNIHNPAILAFTSASSTVPHAETTQSFVNVLGDTCRLSTANEASVAAARKRLARPVLLSDYTDHVAVTRELVALADAREAELDRLRSHHQLAAHREEETRLASLEVDALEALITLPVNSFPDLLAKLDFIADEAAVDEWAHGHIIADVRRLAGAA